VTKSELIALLASRYPQLALRDMDFAVKTVLDSMTQALASGQRIEIRGFGSFFALYPLAAGRAQSQIR
jgi:integration host factor subunit beta